MVITWKKQLQEIYFWGRSEGRCSGHGTFMIASGAYASYQTDFWIFDWYNQNQLDYGNLKGFFKVFFKKPKKSN